MLNQTAEVKKPEEKEITVLLVEDDMGDADLVREFLKKSTDAHYNVVHVERLADALQRIREGHIDIILLDLSLPDDHGFSTFLRIRQEVTHIPIVVLTGMDDSKLALKAVEKGAQDYLVKGDMDANILLRVLQHAGQRQHLLNQLRILSLTDELTGLYNRRGFIFLAQQQLQAATRRKDEDLIFLFIDMDNMKHINDRFGHQEGDRALMDFSTILKETFRSSDIIGRVGGDEFTVLAIEHPEHKFPQMILRLNEMITAQNARGHRPFKLEFSIGMIPYQNNDPMTIQDLLKRADELMYEQKRAKKNPARIREA